MRLLGVTVQQVARGLCNLSKEPTIALELLRYDAQPALLFAMRCAEASDPAGDDPEQAARAEEEFARLVAQGQRKVRVRVRVRVWVRVRVRVRVKVRAKVTVGVSVRVSVGVRVRVRVRVRARASSP